MCQLKKLGTVCRDPWNLASLRLRAGMLGEEVDESKQERVAKKTDAAETDEVVAHGVQVNFTCPNCGAILTGSINDSQEWYRCPKCGFLFTLLSYNRRD
jgi:predicted RNA-binding Zn-ribbon protein involved in translation (DUF1610 family)